MIRRILLVLVAAALVAADVFVYLRAQRPPSATAMAAALTPVAPVDVRRSNDIVAMGMVTPVRHTTLSIPFAGRVAQVLVREGDLVEQYQLLVRLDDREQRTAVAEAEAGLLAAQAQLDKLKAGPREQEIVAADAAVQIAQANLTKITQGLPDPMVSALDQSVTRTIAEEELRKAQAHLELVQSGSRPEDVAVAESAVAQAQATLQQKRLVLAATEIRAPFSGTVAALDLEVGQQLEPLTPIIAIADLSTWQIESTDLDEWGVVNINVGDPVKITFDAIPDLTIDGTLTHIAPIGKVDDNAVTYSVLVQPSEHDPRVHWNMTAQILFNATR